MSATRRQRSRVRALGVALVRSATFAAVSLTGCGRPGPPSAPRGDALVVFAAASLRDAFSAIGASFARSHPDVELTLNFAGTQELGAQLEHGAAADVFASADRRHINELVRAGRATPPVIFARNEPVVVVSTDSAASVRSLADLPNAARIVLGTPDVPIGRYALEVLDRAQATLGPDFRARVEANVVSRELSVRQVLTKVSLGEAQAGIVYRTDALSAEGRVAIVSIPPEINVIAEYPIAVVIGAAHPELARAWVELVLSPEGRRALAAAGFVAPHGDASP